LRSAPALSRRPARCTQLNQIIGTLVKLVGA
jgi:hypothetical protein